MRKILCVLLSVMMLFLHNTVSAQNINEDCFVGNIVVENVLDDPQVKEIIELSDEIADAVNHAVGSENLFTVDMIDYSSAIKVYTNLPQHLAENSGDLEVAIEADDPLWHFLIDHEGKTVLIKIVKGNGVSEQSYLYDVVLGKREGTPEEIELIEKAEARKGHYYINVYSLTDNTFYRDVKKESENIGGELYFTSAYGNCQSVIWIKDGEIKIKYSNPEVLINGEYDISNVGTDYVPFSEVAEFHKSYSVEVERNYDENGYPIDGVGIGDTEENGENKVPLSLLIAVPIAVISFVGLIILFVTRKKRSA